MDTCHSACKPNTLPLCCALNPPACSCNTCSCVGINCTTTHSCIIVSHGAGPLHCTPHTAPTSLLLQNAPNTITFKPNFAQYTCLNSHPRTTEFAHGNTRRCFDRQTAVSSKSGSTWPTCAATCAASSSVHSAMLLARQAVVPQELQTTDQQHQVSAPTFLLLCAHIWTTSTHSC